MIRFKKIVDGFYRYQDPARGVWTVSKITDRSYLRGQWAVRYLPPGGGAEINHPATPTLTAARDYIGKAEDARRTNQLDAWIAKQKESR